MKTLYLTQGYSNICIDSETQTAKMLEYIPTYDINRAYYIDEPMHIIYTCGETKVEKDVKKGDIVITFDHNQYVKENPVTVIKSKEWNKIIQNRRDAEQKAKEEWAANKCNEAPCCDCKCCGCDSCGDALMPAPEPVKKAVKKTKKSKK
jgi:Cys-tRNA synthase (O-phospho-L-seryl-tRNA:Cys-tRNA synthase)